VSPVSAPAVTVPENVVRVHARLAAIAAGFEGVRSGSAAGGSRASAATFDSLLRGALGSSVSASGAAPTAAELRTAVQGYLGIPYMWGGTDPSTGLDCSGFTRDLFRRFGVELPRVSADQLRTGQPVPDLASARPGDLLGWDNGPRNDGVDHVAVYLGDGLMAEAPGTGGRVQIVPVRRAPDAIRRVLGTGTATGTAALDPRTPYAALFESAGARAGVDPQLLALVAQRESGFDPTAGSTAGARGLMQLMPATAQALGVDPYDPAQAIDGAARLLRGHLDAFGSVPEALAAYNAGGGAVRRYGGVPPYAETQSYVRWITERYSGTGRWS
jgi:cell wall-associated NlpC family hydrolase